LQVISINNAVHFQAAWQDSIAYNLALYLGYAYEKSGSLLRPIFVHAMFNAMSVITVLNQ
jgi:membrane protease YdiL (CAAX protease family)